MDIGWLHSLWCDKLIASWWQILLISLFFLITNSLIFVAMWYMRKSVIIEYGFPKRNKKTVKKHLIGYSRLDHLLLIRLSKEAEHKGPLLCLNFACHIINMCAEILVLIGTVGCVITQGDGWAVTLMIFPEYAALLFTTALEFLPHIICLKSVRRLYKKT